MTRAQQILRNAAAVGAITVIIAAIGIPRRTILPVSIDGIVPLGGSPQACTGFNAADGSWGFAIRSCPAQHAFYGLDDPGGVRSPGALIAVEISCCPLPAPDILTDEHAFELERCPDDSVATGSRRETESSRVFLRCTKINTARYQLGRVGAGVYWGTGASGWSGAQRIGWENIPEGIRLAQGRMSEHQWDVDGCVGYPWGSMLVEKRTKYCSGLLFRQLQFRGRAGDPSAGTPVKMFPG